MFAKQTATPKLLITVSFSKPDRAIKFDTVTSIKTANSFYYECSNGDDVISNNQSVIHAPLDASGKIYRCFMRINETQSNIALIKINLGSVSNLTITSPTPNMINFSFTKPSGLYDYLQLTCSSANDPLSFKYSPLSLTFNKNISYGATQVQSYTRMVNRVICGLYYSCFMTTKMIGFDDESTPEHFDVLLSESAKMPETILCIIMIRTSLDFICSKASDNNMTRILFHHPLSS
jgi:hypothetical protein